MAAIQYSGALKLSSGNAELSGVANAYFHRSIAGWKLRSEILASDLAGRSPSIGIGPTLSITWAVSQPSGGRRAIKPTAQDSTRSVSC